MDPTPSEDWDDDGTLRGILLMGSTARSGTSFLGEMLASLKPSIYFFEPELFINFLTGEKVKEENGMRLIEEVFSCHFTEDFTNWLTKRNKANVVKHPISRKCKGSLHSCFSVPKLTSACEQEHLRIIKVIRLRMGWMRMILDQPALSHLKVIHLVRDPRGSLYSMAKHDIHKLDPDYFCPLIQDDLLQMPKLLNDYPRQVFSLVYERFCLDPFGEATRIWQFLMDKPNATLPFVWFKYLDKHTQIRNYTKRLGTYTTRRDSKTEYQAWRNTIPLDILTAIEESCAPAISSLGYNLFGNLENARNLSIPLFSDSDM